MLMQFPCEFCMICVHTSDYVFSVKVELLHICPTLNGQILLFVMVGYDKVQ